MAQGRTPGPAWAKRAARRSVTRTVSAVSGTTSTANVAAAPIADKLNKAIRTL